LHTGHEVDDKAVQKHRHKTHWNQVAENLRKEIRRHSVETARIFMSVTVKAHKDIV